MKNCMENQESVQKGLFTFYKQQQEHIKHRELDNEDQQILNLNLVRQEKKIRQNVKNKVKVKSHQQVEVDINNASLVPKLKSKKLPKKSKRSKKMLLKSQIELKKSVQISPNLSENKIQTNRLRLLQNINQVQKSTDDKIKGQTKIAEQQKNQNIENLKIISKSPAKKKTILSDTQILLKPFQNEQIQQTTQIQNKLFETKDNCDKTYAYEQMQTTLRSKIMSEKFLQKIVRKNFSQISPQNPQIQKQNIELKIKKVNQSHLKKEMDSKKNLFQNDQISNFIVFKKDSTYSSNNYDSKKSKNEKTTLHPKIVRLKTETIHPVHSIIYDKQKQKMIEQLRSFTQEAVIIKKSNEESSDYSNKFMPSHKSSFTVHQLGKQEGKIFEFININKNFNKFKPMSKKLLRFSVIKNSNDGIKNQSRLDQDSRQSLESKALLGIKYEKVTKSSQNSTKQQLKFPLIKNAFAFKNVKTHTSEYEKGINQRSEQAYRIQQQYEQKIKRFSGLQRKHSEKESKEDIKKRLKTYTVESPKYKRNMTQDLKDNSVKQGKQNNSPDIHKERKQKLKKVNSSSIIKNFHQIYYKGSMVHTQSRHLVSMLDMNQNSVFHFKQSFDWKQKKKQIIKKLGINI